AVRDSTAELREAFESLAIDVTRQLEGRSLPDDLYALKNLLSQFMLLPALYVQVRDGMGVWKKDSFEKAREDFEPAEWVSMEAVSRIRAAWPARLPRLQRRLMALSKPWRRQLLRRWHVPVPAALSVELAPG